MTGTSSLGFIILNDVRQTLDTKIFANGPWVHIATVRRKSKEYVAFHHADTNKLYIEQFDPTTESFLRIDDEIEFNELLYFLHESGLLSMTRDFKVASKPKRR